MFELIRLHQMNLMLALCAVCLTMALFLLFTRFLPAKRKWILIGMEVIATLLLAFDRQAYIYSGDPSSVGWIMVRVSNFMVFFLTSGIVFCFNLYLIDLITREANLSFIPKRLNFAGIASAIGMLLAVVSVFTGLYYTFDSANHYQRGQGFLLCYIVPILCPLIQFTVIYNYRKHFSRFIYTALLLYIFVPITAGIVQIFVYGLSLVNMAMVLVSISLYVFTYLDINDEVVKAHNIEMNLLKEEHESMKKLFGQTAKAFVSALEKRDDTLLGISEKAANIARQIAKKSGKSDEECDQAYYVTLLHNAGITAVPQSIIDNDVLTESEEKLLKSLPVISSEILSNIKEFPYLSKCVRYCNERYDGKGYPEGLKGEEIPELSRIAYIADSYTMMSTKRKNKNPLPMAIIREEFIKEAGLKYDPEFSNNMVLIMDAFANQSYEADAEPLESEIICTDYRSQISLGIPVQHNFTEISFKCTSKAEEGKFCAPSIILFDSYDRRSHENQKSIDAYHYIEYGEIWFDAHYISTSARNMEIHVTKKENSDEVWKEDFYKITSARFEDHLILKLENYQKLVEVIVALPDVSKAAYIGITGENVHIYDIQTLQTDKQVSENEIPRIAEKISYINRIESDIPNVQITSPRAVYTKAVEIENDMKIIFHTMSLPEASLVWHCPYIVLFYSEDQKMNGKDYREYAMIKLNGEDNGSNDFAENTFSMIKHDSFKNWNEWKNNNKAGFECTIQFVKKGNRITLETKNCGIEIRNTCVIRDGKEPVYVTLTGDQCALTDIRIK